MQLGRALQPAFARHHAARAVGLAGGLVGQASGWCGLRAPAALPHPCGYGALEPAAPREVRAAGGAQHRGMQRALKGRAVHIGVAQLCFALRWSENCFGSSASVCVNEPSLMQAAPSSAQCPLVQAAVPPAEAAASQQPAALGTASLWSSNHISAWLRGRVGCRQLSGRGPSWPAGT